MAPNEPIYLGDLFKKFKDWDNEMVTPEFPTVIHRLSYEDCVGLGFDDNTYNLVASLVDPHAWLPHPSSKIIDALDALGGMPGLLKKIMTSKTDKLVFRRLAYSLVMFFTPPRLRPMSGMLWMTGRVREAQAPGTLYSVLAPGFGFVYEGCCVCLQQAGKRVQIGA